MVDVRVDAAVGDEPEQVDVAAALPRSVERRRTSAGFSKNAPSSIARFTRIRSWSTTRPEPIVRWPTSEFPIWPAGRPTASPEASSVVCG